MNFEYDPEADAAYLTLTHSAEAPEKQISAITTEGMEGEIEIDIDRYGRVIGIEFVKASSILSPEILPPEFLENSRRMN